jgi:hypothetical protein
MKKRAMKRCLVLAAAAVCFGFNPGLAAPGGLLDKAVKISWFQQTPGNEVGTGASGNAGRAVSLTLYVSSAGRVFAKAAGRTGKYSGEKAIGPESTTFHADGSKLVGVLHQGGATNNATQVAVSFDAGFQSCNVEVILGSQNGKPLEWVGLNGKRYVATGHPRISSQSCSVSSGNPFAG